VLWCALAPRAAAGSPDMAAELTNVQNAMVLAASQDLDGDVTGAVSTLDGASAILDALRAALADPARAAARGVPRRALDERIAATGRQVSRAKRVIADERTRRRARLESLRAAAKAASRAVRKAGRPVVAGLSSRAAGFHGRGEVVRFRISAADGTPCREAPVVEVENQARSAPIDLDSVAVDERAGILSLRMSEQAGGGLVTVSACGRSGTVLVYNTADGSRSRPAASRSTFPSQPVTAATRRRGP
jgi:hypothetical protein